MANFNFDLEAAEYELDNVENLLSVFWGVFQRGASVWRKSRYYSGTLVCA